MLLYTHPSFLAHDTGPGHPERTARLQAILADLRERPIAGTEFREPRAATREALLRVHTAGHVDHVLGQRGRAGMAGDETPLSPASVDAALFAAGAVCDAVEAVCGGED